MTGRDLLCEQCGRPAIARIDGYDFVAKTAGAESHKIKAGDRDQGEGSVIYIHLSVDTFGDIETEDPQESGIYVWDHMTDTVAASGFESLDSAKTWSAEHGPEFEPVDSRPLTEGDS